MDTGAGELGDPTGRAQNLDPGPVDKSVLVEQELHKSEAIFDGKVYKPIRFIEHGTRINQWEVEHEGMLAILQRAGFYHLSFLKRVQLDHALLNALVERWRRETQTFHLRFGEMTVLLKDVAILTGLRVHGTPVTGPTDCRWENLCLELLGQEPPRIKGGSINIAWLHGTFKSLPEGASQSDIEYATRAYILYQIGCSLFPDPSGTRVHLRYLALLRDFDASGEMAWGAAVLAHLYRELGKASMKGKANCCAFLTLLQIWAWEHIQIGCPTLLENKALHNDQPLGCRWNAPFKNRENIRSMDHEFYRHGLDTISDYQIKWDPYTSSLVGGLPELCTFGSAVWQSRTPLICFQIVEMHVPDRVLLQFGMIQHIPDPVEAVERVTMQGKADEDWSTYHDKYIKQWDNRLSSIVEEQDTGNSDPTQARNCYLDWYWQITRRWISTPVECPVISYELSGYNERTLVDLVNTVQGRIRTLLSGEIDGKRVKESLNSIDTYITAEMKKAKQFDLTPCTNEPSCIKYKQQQMALPSPSLQVMHIFAPSGIGNGSVKLNTGCSFVDPVEATVAKLELVSDDHVEGNTILQLDQMKRIQPAGGTPDLGPHPTGDDTSNQTEDVQQQELLDVSMTEISLQDIISTPVYDAMNEIMNISEEATVNEITDAEMKNEKKHPPISYASGERVEVQETVEPIDNNKMHEKAAGLQKNASAPLINGTVEETIGISVKKTYTEIAHKDPDKITNQGTMRKPSEDPGFYKVLVVSSHNDQRQMFCASSGKDDRIKDILNMRTEDSIGQGEMDEPLDAIGLREALNASVNRLSPKRGGAESPSGSDQVEPAATSELQNSVKKPLDDNAVQDRVGTMHNNSLQQNADSQIENENLDPAFVQINVVMPAKVLHITSVGEKPVNSLTDEATDILSREESGDSGHGSPDQNGISKRRKLAIPSHENGVVPPTIEVTKMDGHAKTEEFLQSAGGGSRQLVAFARRKMKKALAESSP